MNKFDVVFSNPPYNRGLDLKIIEAVIPFTEKMIVVMTQRLLTRRTLQKKREKYSPITEKVISIENSWGVFKLIQYASQYIYVFNKQKMDKRINVNEQYYIDHLSHYSTFGQLTKEEVQYIKSIREIKQVENSILKNGTLNYPKKDFIIGYYIAGGAGSSLGNLTSLLSKQNVKSHIVYPTDVIKQKTKGQYRLFLYFNNEKEIEDFRYSYNQIVFRWYISNYKVDHTIGSALLRRIPFIRGKIENKDWKQIFSIPDSLYNKVMEKYNV